MADFTPLEFDRNWNSSVDFPTYQDDETKVRYDMQYLYDAIKDHINNVLTPEITAAIAEMVVGQIEDGSITTAKLAPDCEAPSAAVAASLANAANIRIASSDATGLGAPVGFNGSSATLLLPDNIKANLTGNAATATKLATAKTIRTNLASTSTASFDGSANVTPGVTGTLPIANGGTGQTTGGAALDALINSRETVTATPTDDTLYLSGNSNGNGDFWPRKTLAIYNYIKSKLTASDIPALPASKITSGTLDAARIPNISAAKITDGTLPAARGGTGQGTLVDAMHGLINSMSEGDATPTDASHYIAQSTAAGSTNYYLRPFSTLYTYIKNELTASDIPALPASKITSGTFATARIADGAITTDKIAGSAVTDAKIADSAVTTAKIAGSAVTDAKIADSAVTTAKIADSAVTDAKIASGIGGAKITSPAIGTLGARKIYFKNTTGAPSSSTGSVGDICIVY